MVNQGKSLRNDVALNFYAANLARPGDVQTSKEVRVEECLSGKFN